MPNVTQKENGAYLTPKQIMNRNTLITQFLPAAHKLAVVANRVNESHYTLDDLVSVAYESLVVTATKHIRDGGKHPNFAGRLTVAVRGDIQKFKGREANLFTFDDYLPIDAGWYDVAETTESSTVERDIDATQEATSVRKMLHSLSRQQQLAVNLVYFRDCTHEAAGKVMGVSKQAVTSLIDRSLVVLRQHL